MNKLLIGAFALATLSTGAFAAADDHGGNGSDNPAYIYQNNSSGTNTLAVPGAKDGVKEDYLNWNQLR